jgi:GxxExxY protein
MGQERREPDEEVDLLAWDLIGAAIAVHRALGAGFAESVYEEALCVELGLRGIPFRRQVPIEVEYKGTRVGNNVLDLLVAERLIVELKAVDRLAGVHHAQLLSYLRAANKELGLLINFNVRFLRDGICRIINTS